MTTHAEQRLIRHSPEQLFDLVADVRRYPEFLPWCLASRIRKQTDSALVAAEKGLDQVQKAAANQSSCALM